MWRPFSTILAAILRLESTILSEIKTMSDNLTTELANLKQAIADQGTAITTALSELSTDIANLKNAGGASPDQLAELASDVAAIQANTTTLSNFANAQGGSTTGTQTAAAPTPPATPAA